MHPNSTSEMQRQGIVREILLSCSSVGHSTAKEAEGCRVLTEFQNGTADSSRIALDESKKNSNLSPLFLDQCEVTFPLWK
ncbi:hypothetical protein TNCV_3613051 [Trichonephila clavipes]|uniref:Uncharacterized protein n=1 Tax=Trichonephila clavipes TaxID=2585209 RepID=A0A8X6SL04_TRICX|nr:hypothetical protein TNCV_3613051 [Trichonephila clavipes]